MPSVQFAPVDQLPLELPSQTLKAATAGNTIAVMPRITKQRTINCGWTRRVRTNDVLIRFLLGSAFAEFRAGSESGMGMISNSERHLVRRLSARDRFARW